jgi:hypothetical protein
MNLWISAKTNKVLGSPNPVRLAPLADPGFNSNGRLNVAGELVHLPDKPAAVQASLVCHRSFLAASRAGRDLFL